MRRIQKWAALLLLFCAILCAAAIPLWDTAGQWVQILTTGIGDGGYLEICTDETGGVYALQRTATEYTIAQGTAAGKRTATWNLDPVQFPVTGTEPAGLYAAGGSVWLGLYETAEGRTALSLYRLTDGGKTTELVFRQESAGETIQEQRSNLRLGPVTLLDAQATFAIVESERLTYYRCLSDAAGTEVLRVVEATGIRDGLTLPDGAGIWVTDTGLVHSDGRALPWEHPITAIYAGAGSLYFLDGATLEVHALSLSAWEITWTMPLQKYADDCSRCTDLWVSSQGSAWLTLDEQQLLINTGSTETDCTAMLYPSRVLCALLLCGTVLGAAVLALALWYLLWEHRRLRLPMVVRWGMPMAAAAAILMAVLVRWGIGPAVDAAALQQSSAWMEGMVRTTLDGSGLADDTIARRLDDVLTGERYPDVRVTLLEKTAQGGWQVVADNGGMAPTVIPWEYADGSQMHSDGVAARETGGQLHYVLQYQENQRLLRVDVHAARVQQDSQAAARWMEGSVLLLTVVLLCMMVCILLVISHGLRRMMTRVVAMAAGDLDTPLRIAGGDELTSLSEELTALAGSWRQHRRQQQEQIGAYGRFVPQRALRLLNKGTVTEVDRHTSVSRHLATMMLSFRLPETAYRQSGQALFDQINQVIERTAQVVSRMDGLVFNFAYDGYDAVFSGGSRAAVSAAVAVQQEVLEINRLRSAQGQPPVQVAIALDEGDAVLGVVGDDQQMELTCISSGFATNRHLLQLAALLKAGILCTQAVIDQADTYASRYVGKCLEGAGERRVYEIYDGDPYDSRRAKERTADAFAQGIYSLYGGDASGAKRIFLQLVHQYGCDGGAQYYLYLADHLEKHPQLTPRLGLEPASGRD